MTAGTLVASDEPMVAKPQARPNEVTMHCALPKAFPIGVVGFALLTAAGSARADAAGDAALAKIDKAQKQYNSLTVQYTVSTKEPGKSPSVMSVRSNFKGQKQFTELLSPGDVKGTKVLHLSDTELYVWVPAYRKIRRVASHMNEGGFMGTTYSVQDMSLTQYGRYFTATLGADRGNMIVLALTARADATRLPYGKLELTVDKATNLPVKIKYFDEAGRHIKTEVREGYECEGTICLAKVQRMTDHTKGDKASELRLDEHRINPSLPDDMFSKRNLQH
jgi:outer membrane lipoprotein-sorting protein